MDVCVGDLIFTNFFGEPTRTGMILDVRRNSYGIVSYLTLLTCGQQVYFHPEEIITTMELEKET